MAREDRETLLRNSHIRITLSTTTSELLRREEPATQKVDTTRVSIQNLLLMFTSSDQQGYLRPGPRNGKKAVYRKKRARVVDALRRLLVRDSCPDATVTLVFVTEYREFDRPRLRLDFACHRNGRCYRMPVSLIPIAAALHLMAVFRYVEITNRLSGLAE